MAEYRVLLRGLKDQSDAGRRQFLERFGEAYKMSAEQAAQWLRSRKGVVYAVKTAEAAEKAKRYIESLGGVAEIEKEGAPEAAPAEPARLDLDESPAAAPAPAAPAPVTEASADEAFIEVAAAPAAEPAAPADAFAAPATAGPLRDCPHCGFKYQLNQPVCPSCRRPAVYTPGPTSAAALAYGPTGVRPDTTGYDLSTIFNMTIEIYKNNFGTLYGLAVLPTLLSFGVMTAGAAVVLAVIAGGGKAAAIATVAMMAAGLLVFIPLFLYALLYLTAAMLAAIDVAVRGQMPDFMGILKAIPPIMPLQLMVNNLLVTLIMIAITIPFLIVGGLAAMNDVIWLAVMTMLPIIPAIVIAGVYLMFVMPVTVLEGKWAMDAIQRSVEIGRGYYLRNFAIMFIIAFAAGIVVMIASMIFQMIPFVGQFILSPLVQALATPVVNIVMVLLFYDMRIKKQI